MLDFFLGYKTVFSSYSSVGKKNNTTIRLLVKDLRGRLVFMRIARVAFVYNLHLRTDNIILIVINDRLNCQYLSRAIPIT